MPTLDKSQLDRFDPVVADWFQDTYTQPTEIQEKAWAEISANEHVLISAATGSGKTLAAFLWAINQLATGSWEAGQMRALYISPLKALNNDIRRNLLEPLESLKRRFEDAGKPWPNIRVQTRSGDTSQSDRRKMLRNPPEILITTPESLNLLLASKEGQRSLLGIRCAILDEIHSVVSSKRGVYLMSAVERLALFSGEFQRIALSATVRPMDTVAAFLGGYSGNGEERKPRLVRQASSETAKQYAIQAQFPEEANSEAAEEDFWHPIIMELRRLVASNQSTLIFVNSRRLCEKIAHKLNEDIVDPIAYAHHGSLSREIRAAVEQRLKAGELKAIVATNSLEMGIDIGALDCVVMVQCPGVISSAIQKVGRAGHQVGAVSKAALFPTHSRDFLEAAVLSKAIRERDIEPVRPIEAPLDVLAQIIVSMLGPGDWDIDAMFDAITASYSYRRLQRELFDLTLEMLAGRYAASRLRELKPRVAIDRNENTVTLRKGALMAFYMSGGVIPDRGYFHLRLQSTGSLLGELDEEFVWERKIGDIFSLGVQTWKIERITYNDVFVTPSSGKGVIPPFWKADEFDRDFHYSNRIGAFLEEADGRLKDSSFERELSGEYDFDDKTMSELLGFLRNQKKVTGCPLPHRHHILAEWVNSVAGGAPGKQLVLHTHWGGKVNRPYAMALDFAWEETFGHRAELYVNNDCVVVTTTEEVPVDDVLKLVLASNVEALLAKRLQGSGFFGARFREAAGTALLVTRQRANQRLPLWLSRMRSKKLLDSVRQYDDFPIVLEAWRSCLRDAFDLESLQLVLSELEQGEIDVSVTRSSTASPFAKSVAWRQINDSLMYENDTPMADGSSNIREDLIKSVTLSDQLRPSVSMETILAFERKRQRMAPGYAPTDSLELTEFLKDRVLLTREEWKALQISILRDAGKPLDAAVVEVARGSSGVRLVCLNSEKERALAVIDPEEDPGRFLEWLSYYGPIRWSIIQDRLNLDTTSLDSFLGSLSDQGLIVCGALVSDDSEGHVCDAENFEALLRMQRARSRPEFEPLPLTRLAPFLAERQGLLGEADEGVAATIKSLELMAGHFSKAAFWEEELLPARVNCYQPSWLDSQLLESGLLWYCSSEQRLSFGYEEERSLLLGKELSTKKLSETERAALDVLSDAGGGHLPMAKLQVALPELSSTDLETTLWGLAWRGLASNDTFAAVRKGIQANFGAGESFAPSQGPSQTNVGRRARMRSVMKGSGRKYPGNWYRVSEFELDDDPIASLELAKERTRILFDRYGVLFRELLQREEQPFQWKSVFRALRVMELSGEAIAGAFFQDVPGLQFATPESFRHLRRDLKEDAIFWLNATDPASVCGLAVDAMRGKMPKRIASTRIAYRGDVVVMQVLRDGKELRFKVKPDDPDLPQILEPLRHLMTRAANPLHRIAVESINGEDARSSPFLEALQAAFRCHADHKKLILENMA